MEQEIISSFSVDGSYITVSGILDKDGAEALEGAMAANTIFTLDFGEVSEIKFAAIRSLLRCSKAGKRFCVINAQEGVAEMFETTGVSAFINVCRKPRPLDMSKYAEFGASYMSKAYNSEDGDHMIKVYGNWVPKQAVAREQFIARAVMQFGLNTPLVGMMYDGGETTALAFERINGKRSLSRIISEEPERLEEISRRFARMCKTLHTTECDTTIFPDRALLYRDAINKCKEFSDEEKQKAHAFMDGIPAATTCIHGDMQISNVINDGVEDMWIDLADFSYGNPMFDMGMWYFLCKLNPDEVVESLFHLNREQILKVWDFFFDEYYGPKTAAEKEAYVAQVEKFAALQMLYLGANYGFRYHMVQYVREKLVK